MGNKFDFNKGLAELEVIINKMDRKVRKEVGTKYR